MKNQSILIYLLLLGLIISCKSEKTDPNSLNKQPNILFLFADDQRYNTINAHGNSEIITPNLDQIVNKGTSFTNTYIFGAMNGAVCAPSRAMLMTGRSIFSVEPYHGNPLTMPDTLFPRNLANKGYQTFHTGKWHNGTKAFQSAFDDGSKIFFGGMFDQYSVPTYEYQKDGNYPDTLKSVKKVHSSQLYADAAIDFIQKVDDEKPFLLNVSFQAPHDPRDVDQKYIDLYDASNITLPPNFKPEHPFDNGELDIRDEWLAGYPRTPEEVKANIIAYYAMITHMDEQIGRILQALEKNGLRENTIIVFSADNGLALGQHGLMGKQNLYEHSIKVPLVFQGPSIPVNQQKTALTNLIDIYPTLCDLTNSKKPNLLEGRSLMPALKGEKMAPRSSMIYAYKSNQRALRQGDYKLIKYLVKGQRENQIFNVKTDPWETKNLYNDKAYQAIVTNMEQTIQEELTTWGDKAILTEDNWGIEVLPQWINKVSQETIDWLRGLAERERELRGY